MKRAREEGQDGSQEGENEARKKGSGDRGDLGKVSTTTTTTSMETSGLTDTNSNQMLVQKVEQDNNEDQYQVGQNNENQGQVEQNNEDQDMNQNGALQLFDLPVEILRSISAYLDPASKKNARLVSRAMKEVIESSSL